MEKQCSLLGTTALIVQAISKSCPCITNFSGCPSHLVAHRQATSGKAATSMANMDMGRGQATGRTSRHPRMQSLGECMHDTLRQISDQIALAANRNPCSLYFLNVLMDTTLGTCFGGHAHPRCHHPLHRTPARDMVLFLVPGLPRIRNGQLWQATPSTVVSDPAADHSSQLVEAAGTLSLGHHPHEAARRADADVAAYIHVAAVIKQLPGRSFAQLNPGGLCHDGVSGHHEHFPVLRGGPIYQGWPRRGRARRARAGLHAIAHRCRTCRIHA
jgi:hypothetical protein